MSDSNEQCEEFCNNNMPAIQDVGEQDRAKYYMTIAFNHQQAKIDALEKKKVFLVIAELERNNLSLQSQLSIAVDALENLIKVKGRHNTEIAYKRCEEALSKINALKGE